MRLRKSGLPMSLVSFGFACVILSGCASDQFKLIASNVLGSTGVVSTTQAESFLRAGEAVVSAETPLTEEQEYYLGRGVAAAILGRYKPLRNESIQHYVNVVGRTVAAFSDRPDTFRGYRFLVIDSGEVNAMAAPSGYIFVTRGLLSRLSSEDELAAVLAHEVAHVVKAHGVNAISQAKLTKAISLVGQEVIAARGSPELAQITSLFGDSVDQVVERLVTRGYSRSQEYDADKYAHQILNRAGYDPHALERALSSIDSAAADTKNLGGWYSTHPSPRDRIDELEDDKVENAAFQKGISVRTARFRGEIKGVR